MGVRRIAAVLTLGALIGPPSAALAQKQYGPGASDTEIRVGQTMPYSGPVSAFGTIGRTEVAYFEKINAEGGIGGRKMFAGSPVSKCVVALAGTT